MLEKRDFTLAFALHVSIVALILIINTWHTKYKPMPERLIQVNMVSLKELQAMMAKPKTKDAIKPVQKPKKKKKPKPKPQKKPKAVISPKPTSKPKKKVAEEPDFDPFAPLESSPKKITRPTNKTSSKSALKDMMQGQLSDKALNRYILGMQKAVERQWKVPTEMLDKLKPALVKLRLSRKGLVMGVEILESSGSTRLDETLKKAIYAAAPFQLPDRQYALFKTNTIRFYPLQ